MMKFGYFQAVNTKLDYLWRSFLYILGLFQGTELVYFGGLLNFKYFWGMPDIHDNFWG